MKITLGRIVEAGMEVFAKAGYEGLSMRKVAERLDVQAGSLYYHVKNKDALLALLADRVAADAYAAGTVALGELPADATVTDRILAQMLSLRSAIRRHPGGAALLASSPRAMSPSALALMDRLLVTLEEGGMAPTRTIVMADALLSQVTGFVLQEQARFTAAPDPDLLARYPRVVTAAGRFSVDDLFEQSIRLVCAGRPAD